jgi:hypothetical protein
MSVYESDPRIAPASIGTYPKRRRPVTVLPPLQPRPVEARYVDFFEGEGRTPVGLPTSLEDESSVAAFSSAR